MAPYRSSGIVLQPDATRLVSAKRVESLAGPAGDLRPRLKPTASRCD